VPVLSLVKEQKLAERSRLIRSLCIFPPALEPTLAAYFVGVAVCTMRVGYQPPSHSQLCGRLSAVRNAPDPRQAEARAPDRSLKPRAVPHPPFGACSAAEQPPPRPLLPVPIAPLWDVAAYGHTATMGGKCRSETAQSWLYKSTKLRPQACRTCPKKVDRCRPADVVWGTAYLCCVCLGGG